MCAKYENMWMLDDVDNDGDDVETNGELFCCMVDQRKALRLISNWAYCHVFTIANLRHFVSRI